jgi:hypothetical protein
MADANVVMKSGGYCATTFVHSACSSQFASDWVAARHIQREPHVGLLTVANGTIIRAKATAPPFAVQISVSPGEKAPLKDTIAMNSTEISVPIIMMRIFHP